MNVFLTGFTGVGKSTIGRELAELAGLHFIDLDLQIEQHIQMPIATYFAQEGEQAFRKVEREQLLATIQNQKKGVIALGGGTMCNMLNHLDILKSGVTVYLCMPWEIVYKRLSQIETKNRPTLSGKSENELQQLFSQREHFYELAQLKMPINSTFSTEKLANLLKLSTNR